MKKHIAAIAVLCGGVFPSAAWADAYCSSLITGAFTTRTGEVLIRPDWRNEWVAICNVNQEWKGVPTQTCWAWFSQANAAVVENKHVQVYYEGISFTDCATMETYGNAPAPWYFMLRK